MAELDLSALTTGRELYEAWLGSQDISPDDLWEHLDEHERIAWNDLAGINRANLHIERFERDERNAPQVGMPHWLRQRLNAAMRHLRDAEDYARMQMPAWPTADRIRDIHEQLTFDVINGRRGDKYGERMGHPEGSADHEQLEAIARALANWSSAGTREWETRHHKNKRHWLLVAEALTSNRDSITEPVLAYVRERKQEDW